MRLQLITQLFDPENAIKGMSFVKELSKLGHEVEVVTTYPSYPGGKIYPGYRIRFFQAEHVDGVRVVRLPSYISHGRSSSKRLLSYFSFSLAAFVYGLFSKRPDVIYSYYPPMLGGLTGLFLGALRRCPYIYDIQDLWPDALEATGVLKNKKAITIIDTILLWIYRRSAAIVVLSDGYKRKLISKGVPEFKIHRVYNWCDESRINLGEVECVPSKNEIFNIAYAGNLGTAQSLGFVVDAARILKAMGRGEIMFTFIGDGVERESLMEKVADLSLDNVIFQGRVSPEEVASELQKADALLVHLADDPVFEITIPSKTQAYLAMGKPVIMAASGESSDIIVRSGAGIVCRPCDAEAIAATCIRMSQSSAEILYRYSRSARSFYVTNMSQKSGVTEISNILKSMDSAS